LHRHQRKWVRLELAELARRREWLSAKTELAEPALASQDHELLADKRRLPSDNTFCFVDIGAPQEGGIDPFAATNFLNAGAKDSCAKKIAPGRFFGRKTGRNTGGARRLALTPTFFREKPLCVPNDQYDWQLDSWLVGRRST
jgi:hypothetical protein